ncbi:DNA sulfur modification protein DndB [Blastococcus sp. SYSU D00922]
MTIPTFSNVRPYRASDGIAIPAMVVDENEAFGVVPLAQLVTLVPDPIEAERGRSSSPTMAKYQALRAEVQRAVTGAKADNANRFARYLTEGLKGNSSWVVPPITLYHETLLEQVLLPDYEPNRIALLIPHGETMTAIDGETQRIAWGKVHQALNDAVWHQPIKVTIHHGRSVPWARQSFYDLNTLEVKPNVAVAVGMDTRDPVTRIATKLVTETGIPVSFTKRQLKKDSTELLTISNVRTAIVTTVLGMAGVALGAKPVGDRLEGVDLQRLEQEVLAVWKPLLTELRPVLERKDETVAGSPAVMAALGGLAHRTIASPPRREDVEAWTVEDVLTLLRSVEWDRSRQLPNGEIVFPWAGIAGKVSSKVDQITGEVRSRTFAIGGPKEVGYAVLDALLRPNSPTGLQIRS